MKQFQRPGYWFSALSLVLLVMSMNRPGGGTNTKHSSSASEAANIVTVYRVVSSEEEPSLEPFLVSLPPKAEPMVGALRVMTRLKRKESPFPPGTRVLSVTLEEGGVAWADFNGALLANFPGGSAQEALLLQAILDTLGQFSGVRAVQITVEGMVIESIGGHVDIRKPQPVRVQDEKNQVSKRSVPHSRLKKCPLLAKCPLSSRPQRRWQYAAGNQENDQRFSSFQVADPPRKTKASLLKEGLS